MNRMVNYLLENIVKSSISYNQRDVVLQGHVKMNVFFYDYDDYDHTTLLVDWFENELTRTVEKGHFQKAVAQGNRQSDKTS